MSAGRASRDAPDPTPPVDPARVLAAMEVLGWPDDRTVSAHVEPDGFHITPAGVYWELAEDVIRAADAAGDQRHIIEFDATGWTIKHPLACRPNLFNCPVNRAASAELRALDGPPVPPGQYECSLNDAGDRFLIGDRIDQAEG